MLVMHKVPAVAYICLAALLLVSCKDSVVVNGRGKLVSEQRKLADFDKVVIDVTSDVTIMVGKQYSFLLNAQENLHQHIKTEVSGNTLKVHNKGVMISSEGIKIGIALPELKSLAITGAADAVVKGDVKSGEFTLSVKGASDATIEELHVNKLNVAISGASDINLESGYAWVAGYKISGTGNIEAAKVVSKVVVAKVSGSGNMKLHVTDSLDARITGTGQINYSGSPKVKSKITGSGNINNRNNK